MSHSNRKRASCGLDIANPTDLEVCISTGTHSNYDFICVPIVHTRYAYENHPDKIASKRNAPLTRADVLLSGNDWGSYIVGRLDPGINVDSPVNEIRKRSEEKLMRELKYTSHLGVPAVMVRINGTKHVNLARILYNSVSKDGSSQIWVQVPLTAPDGHKYENSTLVSLDNESHDTSWHWWNKFRLLANQTPRISVCLEIGDKIPDEMEILRWLGEPIKTLLFHTSVFLTNKKGYPVLSKAHQSLLKRFIKLDLQIIVKGPARHGDISFYQQYLSYVYQQSENNDPLRNFARGFEDFLQIPLQPLMDNLESSTYEVFERDPVKYSQYLVAIQAAIIDLVPLQEKHTKVLTVMVVGAGRGPLVSAAITASKNAERKIRVFAVEKNPNAVITLHHRKIEEWGDMVRSLIFCQ